MSSSAQRYDVVIAGGGTAGLALACALADALGPGARIAVVDRVQLRAGAGPRDARAFALSAGAKRMLSVLGVWPAVAAHAQAVSAVDVTDLLRFEAEMARWVEERRAAGASVPVADVAASFQEAVADVLTRKAVQACRANGVNHLVIGGHVAANFRLLRWPRALQAAAALRGAPTRPVHRRRGHGRGTGRARGSWRRRTPRPRWTSAPISRRCP